jgi:hypothetical protein
MLYLVSVDAPNVRKRDARGDACREGLLDTVPPAVRDKRARGGVREDRLLRRPRHEQSEAGREERGPALGRDDRLRRGVREDERRPRSGQLLEECPEPVRVHRPGRRPERDLNGARLSACAPPGDAAYARR